MSQLFQKKRIDVGYIAGVTVGLILVFFANKIIAPWGPVTDLGVAMLGAFVGVLVLITVTGDLIWPACAAYLATIIHGYMDAATATSNFIGTTVIIQLIAATVLCSALRESGAGEVIARKLLTAKAIQGKPVLFRLHF